MFGALCDWRLLCALSLLSQRPSCYLTTIGMEEIFSPSLLSLSLCASGNSKLTFSSWNAASVFERLWNCSGEQHRTAALPPRLYSPIFHPRRKNEESERYACYKNERHGKRFPSRSHSKAERQSETVLQVSSENKVAYGSWRQFL